MSKQRDELLQTLGNTHPLTDLNRLTTDQLREQWLFECEYIGGWDHLQHPSDGFRDVTRIDSTTMDALSNAASFGPVIEVRPTDILAVPAPAAMYGQDIRGWVPQMHAYFTSIGLPCRAVLPMPGGTHIQVLRPVDGNEAARPQPTIPVADDARTVASAPHKT